MKILKVIFICLTITTLGCIRREGLLSAEQLDLGVDTWINDVEFYSPTEGIAVGGDRLEAGYVFKTSDGGETWNHQRLEHDRTLGAVKYFNDSLIRIGGEWIHLYNSTDLGETWEFQWLDTQQPSAEEHRPIVWDFEVQNDSSYWFVGGENLDEGVIYYTWDRGQNFQFSTWEFQFNDITIQDSIKLVAGHGALMRAGSSNEFTIIKTDDHFTGVHMWDDGSAVVVTNQGAIHASGDYGISWDQVVPKASLKRSFTDLTAESELVCACGLNGLISVSRDGGANWNHNTIEGRPNLLSLGLNDGIIYATASSGRVFRLPVP